MEKTIASIAKWTNPIWIVYVIIMGVIALFALLWSEVIWKPWNPAFYYWDYRKTVNTVNDGLNGMQLEYAYRWIHSDKGKKHKYYNKIVSILDNEKERLEVEKTERFKANVDSQINDMLEAVESVGN